MNTIKSIEMEFDNEYDPNIKYVVSLESENYKSAIPTYQNVHYPIN